MSELPVKEPAPVSCEICHQEIPSAQSLSIEAKEYTYYFCGHGCYARWNERMAEQQKQKSSK